MQLSFVVLTFRRPELLRQCLESLGAPESGRWEVCVVFNGNDAEVEAETRKRFPWASIHSIERSCRGEARNRAIRLAKGSIVYFLDDDVRAPAGFARRVLEKFERYSKAPCIGGPNLRPPESGPLQRAIDFLLRSPLGAGPMRVRWIEGGADRFAPAWTLTLCNMGVRREAFEQEGLAFPVGVSSAEENLLLHRIERRLGPVLLSPELAVLHERRNRWGSFCRQVFQSGRGRVQIARAEPRTLSAIMFAPLALPVAIAALVWAPRHAWTAAPLAAYAATCLAESVRMAASEGDLAGAWRLPWLFAFGHLAYAAGLISGVVWP